jgi:hypothetical protein
MRGVPFSGVVAETLQLHGGMPLVEGTIPSRKAMTPLHPDQ